MQHKASRWAIGIVCVLGLVLVYLFQRYEFAATLGVSGKMNQFYVNHKSTKADLVKVVLHEEYHAACLCVV